MPHRHLANPVQTALLIEEARSRPFAGGVRLLATRIADLADQVAATPADDPVRPIALSNVLVLVAEVIRAVATESIVPVTPR